MSKTVRASVILGWATLISLIVGVTKRKLLAVYLGPYGLGIYAQVSNYFGIAIIIASFGVSQAIITYVARNSNNEAINTTMVQVLKSGMSILLFFSFVIMLVSIFFSKHIAGLIMNDSSIYYLLIIGAMGIPFQVLGESILSFLQGMKMAKKISLANIMISILGLIGTIPLVVYLRTPGAVISIPLLAIITFFMFIYLTRGSLRLDFFWKLFYFLGILRNEYSKKLINFGSRRFVSTALYWITFLAMRTIIIKKLGVIENGIYEAAYTFSLLYLPFISNILWSYSYSEYCQAQDNVTLSIAVNKFLRLSLTIIFPILVILLLFRPLLVQKIVFTEQFNPAIKLIPIRFLVDLLTVITWSFSFVLLAKEKLLVIIKYEIIKDILFLGAIISITPVYKLTGLLVMDAVAWCLFLLLFYRYIKKNFNFSLLDKNKYLLISSLLLLATISLFPVNNLIFTFLGFLILILWLLYFVSRQEIKEVLNSLRIIDVR